MVRPSLRGSHDRPSARLDAVLLEGVDAVAVGRVDAALDDADEQVAGAAVDERAGGIGKLRRPRGVVERRVEGDQLVVGVGEGRVERVAHADVQRGVGAEAPRVLGVELETVEAQVQVDVAFRLGVGAGGAGAAGIAGKEGLERRGPVGRGDELEIALAGAGRVLVLLLEAGQAPHLEGMTAALPGEVVGEGVVQVLNAVELRRADGPEAGHGHKRDEAAGVVGEHLGNRQPVGAARVGGAVGVLRLDVVAGELVLELVQAVGADDGLGAERQHLAGHPGVGGGHARDGGRALEQPLHLAGLAEVVGVAAGEAPALVEVEVHARHFLPRVVDVGGHQLVARGRARAGRLQVGRREGGQQPQGVRVAQCRRDVVGAGRVGEPGRIGDADQAGGRRA